MPEVVTGRSATLDLTGLGLFAVEDGRELSDDSTETMRFLEEDTELREDVETMSG